MSGKQVGMLVGVCAASLLAGWYGRGMFGGRASGGMPSIGGMQMPPATVIVRTVQESRLQPPEEYIAKVDPIEDVMIRSEVPGYITAVHFSEGGMVKEGDLLFTIDPRSYQAEANAAEAEMIRAQKLYDRMKSADTRSVSPSDLETAERDLLRAQAAFELARVSLDYTQIKAPVSGRIGVANVTKGNYVTSASGSLARIVQVDPVRVTFSLTDREYLTFRQQEVAGSNRVRVAQVRLPDNTLLATTGTKAFDDNTINPETGTIAVRYVFDNPDGLLVPGGYVTALLYDPDGDKGVTIPQKALLVDQKGTYVLTVGEGDVVGTRRIETGPRMGTEVVVHSGLTAGERIIVDGVQKARVGANVIPVEDQP